MKTDIIKQCVNKYEYALKSSIKITNKYEFLMRKEDIEKMCNDLYNKYLPIDNTDYVNAIYNNDFSKLKIYFDFFINLFIQGDINGNNFLELINDKVFYKLGNGANEIFLVKKTFYNYKFRELIKLKNELFNNNIVNYHFLCINDALSDEIKLNSYIEMFEFLEHKDKIKAYENTLKHVSFEDLKYQNLLLNLKLRMKSETKQIIKEKVKKI